MEIWETAITLLLFPAMVAISYLIDRGLPCQAPKINNLIRVELANSINNYGIRETSKPQFSTQYGPLDPEQLATFVRQATRLGLSTEDAAKLAAFK